MKLKYMYLWENGDLKVQSFAANIKFQDCFGSGSNDNSVVSKRVMYKKCVNDEIKPEINLETLPYQVKVILKKNETKSPSF